MHSTVTETPPFVASVRIGFQKLPHWLQRVMAGSPVLGAAYAYPAWGNALLGMFVVLCSLAAAARAIRFHARFVTAGGPALESETRVWIRRKGTRFARPRAGVLRLGDGTLSFNPRKRGTSFSFPMSEINPRFRKSSYGTGFEFEREGLRYVISFLESEGGRDPFELLAMPVTMWSGHRIGTTWREALGTAAPASTPAG